MVSLQEPGQIEIYAKRIDGMLKRVGKGHISHFAPAGGAADGALASVGTPDTRPFQPVSGPILRQNDLLEVNFIPFGADGIDVSDSIWIIPVTEYNSQGQIVGVKFLSREDFLNPTPVDYTTVANIPVIVGGYKVTEAGIRFGGGPIFLDIQDDTA